jgi:hypothetical protein
MPAERHAHVVPSEPKARMRAFPGFADTAGSQVQPGDAESLGRQIGRMAAGAMTRTIPDAASSELLSSRSLATAFLRHRADQTRLVSRAAADIDLDQEMTLLVRGRRTVTKR